MISCHLCPLQESLSRHIILFAPSRNNTPLYRGSYNIPTLGLKLRFRHVKIMSRVCLAPNKILWTMEARHPTKSEFRAISYVVSIHFWVWPSDSNEYTIFLGFYLNSSQVKSSLRNWFIKSIL